MVTSFDGTPIFTTLFRPAGDAPAPLVLRTHGWGGTGETTLGGTAKKLVDAGYAVLTWDERGFGQSGGEVHIDNPLYEGKDASALIDWADAQGVVTHDKTGDPVVGMTGGSYAGGIQTATAAFDDRIDAIAPEISWRDLRYSLSPGRVIKVGWVSALYGAGNTALSGGIAGATGPAGLQTGRYAADLDRAYAVGAATNELDGPSQAFLAGSSLDHYDSTSKRLTVPTLVMNGSVDTLFNLYDGYGIYEHAGEGRRPRQVHRLLRRPRLLPRRLHRRQGPGAPGRRDPDLVRQVPPGRQEGRHRLGGRVPHQPRRRLPRGRRVRAVERRRP